MTAPSNQPQASSKRAATSIPSDSQRFRAFVEAHRKGIMLHCYRLVGSLHDAEDLTQETFARAWQGIDQFEGRASIDRLTLFVGDRFFPKFGLLTDLGPRRKTKTNSPV